MLEYIKATLNKLGESFDDIIAIWVSNGWQRGSKKISKEEAIELFTDEPAGSGYGGTQCTPFHIYTKKTILFLGCYDGSEWIESIPRHTRKRDEIDHVGGG